MSKPSCGPRLRPNKAGIYYIFWAENNRTKRVSTRTGNLQEAQKVLAGFLLEGEKAKSGRMTVGEMIDYYVVNHVEAAVVDKKKVKFILGHFQEIFGADTYVDELCGDDFTRFRRKRCKDGPLNDATIRRDMVIFLAAANFAVRNRKLENRHVPVIDLPAPNEGRDRWLTREEAQRLLAAAQGPAQRLTPVYRLVAIALGTGKRRGSIEPLTWFQVDLKNRQIDFRRPGEPETKKRRGRAPISSWLLPILERAHREKTNEYVLGSDFDLWRPLSKVAKAALLKNVSCHTLRHTWGTWAAQGGASIWDIAGVMGCSVATATRNYLHHCPAHLRDVADSVSPEAAEIVSKNVQKDGL